MFHFTKRIFLVVAILVTLLCQGRAVSAQCMSRMPGYKESRGVSLEPGNPFLAEYSVSNSPSPTARLHLPLPSPPGIQSIERDSQGRVRVDFSAGTYKLKAADGTETEQEKHLVNICDPASGKLIQLDTLNKTATVQGPRFGILTRPAGVPSLQTGPAGPASQVKITPQPFCRSYFNMFRESPINQWEDLGSQIISGVEAQGLRVSRALPGMAGKEGQTPSISEEIWCSEDISAIVMRVTVSTPGGHRQETLLKNIERREPDAAGFEIPADYTIEERAIDSKIGAGPRPAGTSPAANSPQ